MRWLFVFCWSLVIGHWSLVGAAEPAAPRLEIVVPPPVILSESPLSALRPPPSPAGVDCENGVCRQRTVTRVTTDCHFAPLEPIPLQGDGDCHCRRQPLRRLGQATVEVGRRLIHAVQCRPRLLGRRC